jgi:hypothetical protein
LSDLGDLLVTIIARAGEGVQGLPGDEPWKIAGGVSTFTTTDRPHRSQLVDFDDVPVRTMTGQILFDRWREGGSVEDRIRSLKRIGRPRFEGIEPFPALVMGNAIPAEARSVLWFLQGIEEQDGTLKNSKGQVVRARFNLTFIEETTEDGISVSVKEPPKTDCSKAKAKKGRRHLTLKKDDTVQKVAKRELGNADCWKVIKVIPKGKKKAERIRDPKKVKPGDELRLP